MAIKNLPHPAHAQTAVMTQDMSGPDGYKKSYRHSLDQVHDFVVHTLFTWGESWSGSKAQLQSIGIGAGIAYPGEPGGNKRVVRTTNSQGDELELKAWNDVVFHADLRYCKSSFTAHDAPIEFAPGVLLVRHHSLYGYVNEQDEYRGSGDALVACGLVLADQLPGSAGRGKTRCSYFSDGRTKTTNGNARRQAGDWSIEKRSNGFRIFVEAVRSEQEADSWKQKYESHRSEIERACAVIRAKRKPASDTAPNQDIPSNQGPAPSFMEIDLDESIRRLFSNGTDDEIDWMVESSRRSYDRALRISREVKDARRQEASSIASSDGVVIFPKRWQRA